MFEMLGGDKKKLVMYAFLAILLFFIISKKSEAKRIEVPTKVVDEEQHVKVVQEEQSAKVVQEEQPKKVVQEEQPRKVVQEEQNVTEKFNNKQKTKDRKSVV